jgi:putative transposase
MPRIARVVVPGIPHHVTQRGNRRQNIFFSDADRHEYLRLVLAYSIQAGLLIIAYCLMTNHVHLIAIPALKNTLEKVFKPVHTQFAQHFNNFIGCTGRVFQSRFFSCPLDDDNPLWNAIRYVERNPVRAGMVLHAEDYPWSSARAHCGLNDDPMLSSLPTPNPPATNNWSDWLKDPDDETVIRNLRLCTRTGRPFGSDGFVTQLENQLGRKLRPRPGGRPAKKLYLP